MSTEKLEKRLRAAAPLRTPADLDARILRAATARLGSRRTERSRLPIAFASGFALVAATLLIAFFVFDRARERDDLRGTNLVAAAGRGFFVVGVEARFKRTAATDAITLESGELTAEARETPLTVEVPGGRVKVSRGRARIAVSEHEGSDAETEAERLGLEPPRGSLVKTIVDLLSGEATCEAGDDVTVMTGPEVAVMPFDRVDGGILRLRLKATAEDKGVSLRPPDKVRPSAARPSRILGGFVPEAYRGRRGRVGFLARSALGVLGSDRRSGAFVSCILPDDLQLAEERPLDSLGAFSFASVPDYAGALVVLFDDRAPSALLIDPERLPTRPVEVVNEALQSTVVVFQGHRPLGSHVRAELSLTVRTSRAPDSQRVTYTTSIGDGRKMKLLGPPRETFEFLVEGSAVLRVEGERPFVGRGAPQVVRLFEGRPILLTILDPTGRAEPGVVVEVLTRSEATGRPTAFFEVSDDRGEVRISVTGTPVGIAAWSEDCVAFLSGYEAAALSTTTSEVLRLDPTASFHFRARAATSGRDRKASLISRFLSEGRNVAVGADGLIEFSAHDSPSFSLSLGGKPVALDALEIESTWPQGVEAPAFSPATVRLGSRFERDAKVDLIRYGASILEATHEIDRLAVAANGTVAAPMPVDMLALRFGEDVFHWRRKPGDDVVDFALERCRRAELVELPLVDGEPALATAISPIGSGWVGTTPSSGSLSFLRPPAARSLLMIGNDRGAAAIVLAPGAEPRLPPLPKGSVAIVIDTRECLVRRSYALCLERVSGMDFTALPSALRIAATGTFSESGAFMARRLTPGAYTLEIDAPSGLVRLPIVIDDAVTYVSVAY